MRLRKIQETCLRNVNTVSQRKTRGRKIFNGKKKALKRFTYIDKIFITQRDTSNLDVSRIGVPKYIR